MIKLKNGGIEISIYEADIERYLIAGYERIEEPVEIPAPEVEQELPPEKAAEPVKVVEPDKKAKKVVKHGTY
jgi:hypothetical protein